MERIKDVKGLAHEHSYLAVENDADEFVYLQDNGLLELSEKEFPGPAAFKSLKERCDKLEEKVKAWAIKADATPDKICSCVGCCKGDCFYPVTEQID
jgi:hypothetical protein